MPAETVKFVDVVLSWARESPGKTAVLRKEDDGSWDELARVEGTEYTVKGLHPELTHSFAASPVLEDGGLAPEADWETAKVSPLADASAPALPQAPTGFAGAQDGATLNLRWDAAEGGVTAFYEVREGSSWEDGTLVAKDLKSSPYTWSWWASGQRNLHIKAVDSLGRYSVAAASLSVTIEPLGDHVTAASDDQGGQSWPGQETQLEGDGSGGLRLEALPLHFGAAAAPFGAFGSVPAFARYWPEGVYESPPIDVGQVEHQRIEVDLGLAQPIDLNLPFGSFHRRAIGARRRRDGTYVPLGTRGFASRNSWKVTPLLPVDTTVEVDTSPTPAGAWDGWRPFAPGTYAFQRVRLRVTVRGDGLRFVRIPRLVLVYRKLNRKQEGDIVVGPDDDVVVPFPVPFQNAPRVTAHILGFPGSVEIVSVTTTGVVLRPGAAVFAESPATFAPTIHWQAMGT